MSSEEELGAYIREINVITKSMLSETDSYARYRAIGEGFGQNVECPAQTPSRSSMVRSSLRTLNQPGKWPGTSRVTTLAL